jgi:DNA-binding CsgD family transcriptional regulator
VSDGDSLKHHIKNGYKYKPDIPPHLLNKKFYFLGLSDKIDMKYDQAIYDYRNYFGMDYPFFIVERYQQYSDIFIFGSIINNSQIINFYLNNTDILENFKLYFKEKAQKLFKEANKNKIFVPEQMRQNFRGLNAKEATKQTISRQRFNINRYMFEGEYKNISLTKREIECLKYLVLGYTAKETANKLNISPKTVESYLYDSKTKLRCYKKSQVIDIIMKYGASWLFF